jgi:hypothetical protein
MHCIVRLAVRLLSQVSSACSCEQAWSAYDFIHNKRRNRLTAARARDPLYVFTNGRLVDKMADGTETFVGWEEEEEMEGDVVLTLHMLLRCLTHSQLGGTTVQHADASYMFQS